MRTLSAMLVAAALLLVGAAPALAVTGGFGVEKALQTAPTPVLVTLGSDKLTSRNSCDTGGKRAAEVSKAKGFVRDLGKKFLPVACEQPPRSEPLASAVMRQATAAALALLG